MIWLELAICSAGIILAAILLTRFADILAEKTGLGRVWIGAILLAGATSLPELASGVSAVTWLNAPNLAIGAILGSCLFNLVLIAIMDLVYQPGSILAKAQEGHILSGGIGIVLLGVVGMGAVLGSVWSSLGWAGVGILTPVIIFVYFIGTRLVYRFEKRRMSEVHSREAEILQYEQVSKRKTLILFTLSALAVVVLGVWLASIGDRLSGQTGLSRSFVGTLFLAIVTSLPEVATSLAAIRIGATDMAISSALGSNLFNILILAAFDLADLGKPFWPVLSDANAFSALMAVCMSAVVIISLIYRASPKTPSRLNWDGVILLGSYALTIGILYVVD